MRGAVRRALIQDMRQRAQAARVLQRLGALLDDLGRDTDSARSDLAGRRSEHVGQGLVAGVVARLFVGLALGIVGYGGRGMGQRALERVVGDEEEGGAGSGADNRAADAAVDA